LNNCSVRVKKKEVTYNVTCISPDGYNKFHDNMSIKLSKADVHAEVDEVRLYLKKLIILSNKSYQPMLFLAVDYYKLPKQGVWHAVYKMKNNKDCPYVSLRISTVKTDFQKSSVNVSILDFVYGGASHERLVALTKVRILKEINIELPSQQA